MAEREEDRPALDELTAVLRAIHGDHQALGQELRLLREEIRALREERGVSSPQPRAPAAPARIHAAAPARPATAEPALPTMPTPRPSRGLHEFFNRALARLPTSLTQTSRSVLERTWLLAFVVGLLVAGASELNLLQPVEVLADYPKEWVRGDRSRREVVSQIVAVAIDEGSIQTLGAWGPNWRAHHGRLLQNLADDGAKAVGFDLYFKTPNDHYDPAFLEGIRYAKSKRLGVVVGMEYDARQNRLSDPAPPVRAAVTAFASTYLQKDRVTNLVRYVSMFQSSGSADDGMTRLVPAFSLAVALAGGKRVEDFPRYREGIVPIDFAGPSTSFQTVPYLDVYERRFAPGTFNDKYVLVGAFFAASRDFFDTPVESEMPGVLIHANALYTLLRGVGRPLGLPWSAALILAVAVVTGSLCGRFRRTSRTLLVVAFVVGYWGLAIGLGLMANPLNLDVVPATGAIGLMWASVTVREKIVALRELRLTLGLPEEAVRRLEQDPTFQKGTLEKRLTVLASDVKNYSVFSRSHPLPHVREIMDEYQQMVERIIFRHGGYVNKFIGDAVVAIFGYPMGEEDMALRCIRAAKETQEGLSALTEKWRQENKDGLEGIRIGINTGLVSISYLGSSKKQLDVMGTNVDMAARLESAAGEFSCLALLGPETYEEVKTRIRSRAVPVHLTKNRSDDTSEAFTLDGLEDEPVAGAVKA